MLLLNFFWILVLLWNILKLKSFIFLGWLVHSIPPSWYFTYWSPIFCPKEIWKYLGFIFNRKLFFHYHIDFYTNKSISMVKCMKISGNSVWELNLHQKHLLYRSCIILITLYRFQLWYYNKAPLTYPLKQLGKIQRRAAIWILGAFKTSLLSGVKAITGLIPINLHLKKLSRRSQLWAYSLSSIISFVFS